MLKISSTLIRKRVRENGPINEFYSLIPKVVDYINEKNLWDKEIKIIENRVETEAVNYEGLNHELLTRLLKSIGFLNADERVSDYKESLVGGLKGYSGTLLLISDIEYYPENKKYMNQLVVKVSGHAGGYHNDQNNFETYFYTKCIHDLSIFFKVYGSVNFLNKSLIFMEYYNNSTCVDEIEGLNIPQTLLLIKKIVSS